MLVIVQLNLEGANGRPVAISTHVDVSEDGERGLRLRNRVDVHCQKA